jgi:copper(I)-binding protein
MHVNLALSKPRHALLLAALALAACQQSKESDSKAAPDAKPGLAVTQGRLVLPVVKGNPGAAYFTVTNTGSVPATLAAVHVDGAGKAEMHETAGASMEPLKDVSVPAGGSVAFARGGKHVMLFDLDDRLVAVGTTEMTLTFAGGDKVSAPLKIEKLGGDTAGMDHH